MLKSLKVYLNTIPKREFYRNNSKAFSNNHSKIIVIGGGTAGITVSNQLIRDNVVKAKDISIFDPQQFHHYQPGWTKVAIGVIETDVVKRNFLKYNIKDLAKSYNFQNHAIKSFDPENNAIETEHGQRWTYDHLIVAAGLQINIDALPGLRELIEDETNMVGTVYHQENYNKVARMRKAFKGGRALFTMPAVPVKCAGAPQKVAWMCDDYWKKHNIKADIQYFTPLPAIFGAKYYSDVLENIAKERGIKVRHTTVLQTINKDIATFKNITTNEIYQEYYDFIHVVPPQSAPDFLKGSPISNAAGFVDVHRDLRHKVFNNVWAIGDCVSLPNSKTAAAIFSEAPVLVYNLKQQLDLTKSKHAIPSVNKTPDKIDPSNPINSTIYTVSENGNVIYDGYTACPLFLKKYQLMMAEFREYNNEKDENIKVPDESFEPGKQTKPKAVYYFIAKSFTFLYPLALKGYWFGKHSLVKPIFPTPKDYRHIYGKLLKVIYGSSALFALYLLL